MATTEKHAGGRPTSYDPKYCDEIIAFFNVQPYRVEKLIKTNKDGSTEEKYTFKNG